MYDEYRQFRRENFEEFLQLFHTLHEVSATYQETYEVAELEFSKKHGMRIFKNFMHFHNYKARYNKRKAKPKK
jgi:hypothetical protein